MRVIYVLSVLVMFLTGCANWKQAAYKSTGTVVITVDAAMTAWASYVATGQTKPEQEVKVKAAYEKYQSAALTVISAGQAATTNETRALFDVAVAIASATQADLVALVKSFLPARLHPKPLTVNTP